MKDRILTPAVVRVLRALGLLGFAASITVHVSTFLGVVPGQGFLVLHVVAIALGFAAVLVSRRETLSLSSWSRLPAPTWAKVGTVLLFVYAAFNFLTSTGQIRGKVHERGGETVLVENGVTRPLDGTEAERRQVLEVRTFSGHWIAFFALEALLFSASLAPRRDEREDAPPEERAAPERAEGLPEAFFPLEVAGTVDLGDSWKSPDPAAYREILARGLSREELKFVRVDDTGLYFETPFSSRQTAAHRGEIVLVQQEGHLVARYRLHFHRIMVVAALMIAGMDAFTTSQEHGRTPLAFMGIGWLWLVAGSIVMSWIQMRLMIRRAAASAAAPG